jgi:Lon protease-like protein
MESESKQPESPPKAHFPLPDKMPVMVLSNCFLLPGCFLPLFIFEERYRLMLKHALETNRMFCVGIRKRASGDSDEVLPVTTAGLIRACVKNEDGTSQLMLHGVQRIRFKEWTQEEPFRIARVEPIITVPCPSDRLAALQQQAVKLLPPAPEDSCDAVKIVREAIKCVSDPELVCDILAYHFVKRACTMKSLLAEPCLETRYGLLIAELARLAGE